MRKLIFGIFIFTFFVTLVNADTIYYNVADFSSTSFNSGLPLNTGNKAGVSLTSEAGYSGSTLVSDSSYNIADFSSTSFNNGLPINTGKSAKVVLDKTEDLDDSESISNDVSYNIADFSSNGFNSGLPINTGKKAKVTVDNESMITSSGSYIYGTTSYNVASFQSESFNSGLPINTGKQAKVLVSTVTYEDGELIVDRGTNYNTAAFQSESFNNGLPIDTGKRAKVSFIQESQYRNDENISITEDGDITYSDVSSDEIEGQGYSKVYTNTKKYIFQGIYEDNKNINLENIAGDIYNTKSTSNVIVMGDDGVVQTVINKNPTTGEKFNYTDNNQIVILDGAFYNTDTSILQVFLTGSVVTPPVLTYPYGVDSTYALKTNFPIIKGMAYPNSILEVTLGDSDIYYVKVDNDGLFQFNPSKEISDGTLSITFQYVMIEGDYNLTEYTDKKLLNPKVYSIEVDGSLEYSFPYITTIYNDDYIYTNQFILEGFANPGEINYELTTIDGTSFESGTAYVNSQTKKFSFLVGNENNLTDGKYIIKVWQDGYSVERKSFEVKLGGNDGIGILNIKDGEILPTLNPVFIGYSDENTINNDTIRVFACDITGNSGDIIPCLKKNRILVGTANTDINGLFSFTPAQSLENEKYYEFEFINTSNTDIYKKVVVKTDVESSNTIYNSQLTSIISGLIVDNSENLNISGFTLPNTTININGDDLGTSDENGVFNFEVPFSDEIVIIYGGVYSNAYKIYQSGDKDINISGNYLQNFNSVQEEILEKK